MVKKLKKGNNNLSKKFLKDLAKVSSRNYRKKISIEPSSRYTKTILRDNPINRMKSTIIDRVSRKKKESFGSLRLNTLNSIKELEKSSISYSHQWIQMGPTTIPEGGTISSYYYDDGLLPSNQVKTANVTGRITSIVIDPFDFNSKTIYVGTALGGVWKTDDGARNWRATSDKSDSLAIGTLVMDPCNPKILYAGTGEGNFSGDSYYGIGVLKTVDGGEHWHICGDEQQKLFLNSRFCRIVIDPHVPSTLFAAVRSSEITKTASGIYRSKDSGLTWTRVSKDLPNIVNSLGATDIRLDPQNPSVAYAAFYKDRVYKTTNANADKPSWVPQKLIGLDAGRICISISPSNPEIVYVLAANKEGYINQFYRTINAGKTWERINISVNKSSSPWEDGTIGDQGDYNIDIAVDPKSSDIVYLAGISLWKVIYNKTANNWIFRDIGKSLHPDNHTIVFDPKNNFRLYVGNDGGIYKSIDGGETWDDTINEGLCITQFEYMACHPNSDAVIFAGSQDNGTLQFRNSPAFYCSAGGDGGFVSIDPNEPNNIIHQFTENNLEHNKQAGKIDSWIPISAPNYPAYFYAPFSLDESNPKNIAFGAKNIIFLDKNQGLDGWMNSNGELQFIFIPYINKNEWITTLNYVNSNLIYAGTSQGKIFCITKKGKEWNKPIAMHVSSGLPDRCVWDIAFDHKNNNTIIVVMASFWKDFQEGSHVWRGKILKSGKIIWDDINPRNDNNEIINIQVKCVVIDKDSSAIYIGTEIGVFRTIDNGKKWELFNQGLPNCPVHDIKIQDKPKKLIRLVTHGRGMWERLLDSPSHNVDIFIRDHLMDTGRYTPSKTWKQSTDTRAAFDDPYQDIDINKSIRLGSELHWDMCQDIKIDSPKEDGSFQMQIEDVDYVKFESKLYHSNLKRAKINRVYVQIHNRGIKPVSNDPNKKVIIRLFYTELVTDTKVASRHYHDLPKDFWTKFSKGPLSDEYWHNIGEPKFLPDLPKTLTNTEPTILEWDWIIPIDISNKVWILVVVDSPDDPIPQSNKIFDLEQLVRNEKHIGARLINVDPL
jgi:photosystem II stability/assembly factor-like uncharacterized protein